MQLSHGTEQFSQFENLPEDGAKILLKRINELKQDVEKSLSNGFTEQANNTQVILDEKVAEYKEFIQKHGLADELKTTVN